MSQYNQYVCLCEQFSCNTAKHEVAGVGTVCGRVLSRQVYQQHQQKESQRYAKKRQGPSDQPAGGEAGQKHVICSFILVSLGWFDGSHIQYMQAGVTEKAPETGVEHVLLIQQEALCKQVMIQTAKSVYYGKLTKKGAKQFLEHTKENVELLASIWSSQHKIQINPSAIVAQIPATRKAVFHRLGLEPTITTQVCCNKCFALYPMDSDDTQCSEKFYSESQLYDQWAKTEKIIPKCGQDLWCPGSKKKRKPVRKFVYVKLTTWLKDRLSNPQFETALDASLVAINRDASQEMEDVWHGRVWQDFPNDDKGEGRFTQHSGNLVFSLYLDWFNAEGASNLGKHNSIGSITLVCLNLPPTHRYKVENMYLFGIIPGPTEPSLEQINHLLRPLVEELQKLWMPGHFFSSTAAFPQGRMIRVAIFPLIADLPALRKAAGFGSHQATKFCSFCLLEKKDIEETDISKFPLRDHDQHIKHATEWLETDNHTAREKLVKERGARWSVLNELKYWRPIEYCTIELMHALILGDLKDHSLRFFSLPAAAAKLKNIQKKDIRWQNDQSYTEPPYTNQFGPKPKEILKKDKGKRKREPSPEASPAEKRTKRTQKQDQGQASGFRQPPSLRITRAVASSSSGSSSTHETSTSENSSSHSYNLRLRKQIVYEMSEPESGGSDYDSDGSDKTINPNKQKEAREDMVGDPTCPKLTPEELDVVRRTILHTTVPSWIDRVPQNLGAASHGSLKAAEWLILYKIYYIIALIPLWNNPGIQRQSDEEKSRISALLESTTLLSTVTHFLTLPKIKPSDLRELEELLVRYRKCLQKNWPKEPSRPNLHLTQHYSAVIQRFGPPRSTAAWAQERVNGLLQRFPTNHHPGQCYGFQ